MKHTGVYSDKRDDKRCVCHSVEFSMLKSELGSVGCSVCISAWYMYASNQKSIYEHDTVMKTV